MWYSHCALGPRDDYWCPTKVHPETREQEGGDNSSWWGYCPDHLIRWTLLGWYEHISPAPQEAGGVQP